jgi:hypothetical protein
MGAGVERIPIRAPTPALTRPRLLPKPLPSEACGTSSHRPAPTVLAERIVPVMKQTQWVPATIVLVAVGILIGGASLLRTFADEPSDSATASPVFKPATQACPRALPTPPSDTDAEPGLKIATPRAEAFVLPTDLEVSGAAATQVLDNP